MIDTSYLYTPPVESWGYMDVNDSNIISAFEDVNNIVRPKNVIEIGMFAGHSTLVMLSLFKDMVSLTSYDPGAVSLKSSSEIKKRHPAFSFVNSPIWDNEDQHSDVDLIFVDGDHQEKPVLRDINSVFNILPRFVLFDNVEHGGVSAALRKTRLYNVNFNPKYYFYTNTFKNQHKPGIMMLLDLQNVSERDILTVLQKIAYE